MKIGITGIAGGGKTVFLSSLLWQLAELDSADFSVGSGVHLHGFREEPLSGKGLHVFPFEKYRDILSRSGRWPEKTTDCFRYACTIHRSDWKKLNVGRLKRLTHLQSSDRQRLEFLDFPGERIADAAVAAFDRYAEWSEHLLNHFKSHTDYLAAATPYLDLLAHLSEETGEGKVVHAYKLVLAGLIHGYKPLISPSTFLLDRGGVSACFSSDEALASDRVSGLDAAHQFAPLSKAARAACPVLAKRMESHYKKYRQRLVLPLFEEIGKSQRLIVLVDIPSLLAGGVGRYNDNRQIVLDLFDALRPDSSLGACLLRMLTFWKGGLNRVAFVAAKADLVHPDDIRNGRLKSLLQQMTVRAKNALPGVTFDWFVCSAIYSTRAGIKSNALVGKKTVNNPDHQSVEFSVPAVPESWPSDWVAGDFRFVGVLPDAPKNLQIPPNHLGLDRLFAFLIQE